MDQILLQQIRDKLAGVTSAQYGTMNRSLYLQEIRDLILGAVNRVHGTMNELIYLQQIRNAILGVPDGQFGTMSRQLYLQEIRDAFSGLTAGNEQGSMEDDLYLEEIFDAAASDSGSPTCTITSTESTITALSPFSVTITFTDPVTGLPEAVNGFVVGDITVGGAGGGTAGNLAEVSDGIYTADITPTNPNIVTVDVGAGVCTDLAGNPNTAATQFSILSTYLNPSAHSNGALPGAYIGAAFAVSSGVIKNTPTVGANVIANGTFDADANWTKGTGWAIGSGVANKTAGTSSQLVSTSSRPLHKFYKNTYDVTITAGSFGMPFWSDSFPIDTVSGSRDFDGVGTSTGSWGYESKTAASAGTLDNVTCAPLTLNTLIATLDTSTKNVIVKGAFTRAALKTGGVISHLDSTSSPANFIYAAIVSQAGAMSLFLYKCVGGIFTRITNGSITEVPGANVEIRATRSGSNLLVSGYYNGTIVGTQQTVGDAGIVDNTKHGILSTNNANSFGVLTIAPNP